MGCHLWGHTESDTTEVTQQQQQQQQQQQCVYVNPRLPIYPNPPSSFGNREFVFYVYESISVL